MEEKYLLLIGYRFIIPDVVATINKSPPKCIAICRVAFSYGLRFPLDKVILESLHKYELVPAQVVPTSWHNVCFFIVTCELCGLSYIGHAFGLVHTIQRALSEIGDTGWYSFNNMKSFMTLIEKKSKLKNRKEDFRLVHHETG